MGDASWVLYADNTKKYHDNPKWQNTIKCYGQESLKYQEITCRSTSHLVVVGTPKFPFGLVISAPKGVPEIFKCLLAVHVSKCFPTWAICWEQIDRLWHAVSHFPSFLLWRRGQVGDCPILGQGQQSVWQGPTESAW